MSTASKKRRPKGTDWGAVAIQLPRATHREIKARASALGVPLSQVVAAGIEAWSLRARLGVEDAFRPEALEGKKHEFCISLPCEAYFRFEDLRARRGLSRSQAVALAWEVLLLARVERKRTRRALSA